MYSQSECMAARTRLESLPVFLPPSVLNPRPARVRFVQPATYSSPTRTLTRFRATAQPIFLGTTKNQNPCLHACTSCDESPHSLPPCRNGPNYYRLDSTRNFHFGETPDGSVLPNPAACCAVVWTHRAMADRVRASSRASRPAMVQPPGAVCGWVGSVVKRSVVGGRAGYDDFDR